MGQAGNKLFAMQLQHTLQALLQQPLISLALSDDFKARSAQMGLCTLQDILLKKQKSIQSNPVCTKEWMEELIDFAGTCGFIRELDNDYRY